MVTFGIPMRAMPVGAPTITATGSGPTRTVGHGWVTNLGDGRRTTTDLGYMPRLAGAGAPDHNANIGRPRLLISAYMAGMWPGVR